MQGNRQFTNFFLPNASSFNSSNSHSYHPVMKQSQYFDASNKFGQQPSVYSLNGAYCDKNLSTQQSSQRNSMIYESQINGKHSQLLERSRSQIIHPIYTSPFKKEIRDDMEQSRELGMSKASQVTFSKPSQFIINTTKQSLYQDNLKKSFISQPQIVNNDYGYACNNFYVNSQGMKNSFLRVCSPMKQSFLGQSSSPSKNSIVFNQSPPVIPQVKKINENLVIQNKLISQKPIENLRFFKNQPIETLLGPELRRTLSNVSIMSQKSKSKLSETKIKFNYISPAKSENKTQRKLSFRKEDVRNPLSKLSKKKQQKKTKNQVIQRPKINSQAVNEYFPEFKVKRNKMKVGLSAKNQQLTLNFLENKQRQKSEISDESQRRNTFIASLDAFSQISEIKQKEKEESTEISTDTPKKLPHYESQYCPGTSGSKKSSNSIAFNKIEGYRITLEGQRVPIKSFKKQDTQTSKSRTSKDQQLSVNSMKNGDDGQFLKKYGNDSSHTTDYEDEIVKKIKQELGLNFSYHRK